MKIGVAQINSVVGDFPGNAKRILASYRECLEKGAEIVITPELALVGYPPQDLLFKSGFVEGCLQALDYLADEIGEVPLLVGYVDQCDDSSVGKPFRNAVAFLHKGKISEKRWKTLLPTYDVFDESRYFRPSEKCEPIAWAGKSLGVTICEDIWTEEYLHRPLYKRDPVEELTQQGADVILNLSASPFSLGKAQRRQKMLSTIAKENSLPLVYCNSVGGNDQLIFDGNSLVMGESGEICGNLKSFEEECLVVDISENGISQEEAVMSSDEEGYRALVLGLRDYAQKCGFSQACLGLSGGIDSALTAVIACEALGPENVMGLTMPSKYSSGGSVDHSVELAKNLGMSCETVPISGVFDQVKKAMNPVFGGLPEDVTEENMQARIRGLFLMSLSNKAGRLLLTTGNKSELAVGYCTMYGDMCGGLAVISDLPKTLVFSIAKWINRDKEVIPFDTITKPPSAELRPDQKDQDTLPPYEILDKILELYVEKNHSASEIVAKYGFEEDIVLWVKRRVDFNEWKRYQAAPGLRVSSKAFGMGRRIPIVKKFNQ